MKLSEHFELKEFVASRTAKSLRINNEPAPCDIEHLKRLCDTVLEPLRSMFGDNARVYITSGYRCPELNKAVGGVSNSQHLQGLAADIHVAVVDNTVVPVRVSYVNPYDVFTTVNSLPSVDQSILYDGFVHVSIAPDGRSPRNEHIIKIK